MEALELEALPRGRRVIRLRLILRELGISQAEFAQELDMGEGSLRRWLTGASPPSRAPGRALRAWLGARSIPFAQAMEWTVMADDIDDLDAHRKARTPKAPKPITNPSPKDPPVETNSLVFLDPADLRFFKLPSDPFESPDDPDEVYLSDAMEGIDSALMLAIDRRQIVAVHAPSGAGKTTLIRRLYGRMAGSKRVRPMSPASQDRQRITHAALGVAILRDLIGKDTSGFSMEARSELLRTTLEEQTKSGVYPVLVIDEAHLLKTDALLAIKQLWDSHTLFRQLAVILIGQDGLRNTLKNHPDVRELTGRTRILEVPKLGDDTASYLRWRFARVGANADDVFDTSAYKALATRGEYPLWVNNLAVLAMQYAHSIGDTRVMATHVGQS